MEFRDVIEVRQSVRSLSERPVEEEKINQVLECARLAPSWANKQCWHYVVATDRKVIEEIARGVPSFNAWIKKAPVVVVACGDPKESGSKNGIEYFAVDVAISMQHLVLAATDLGLGTCWMAGLSEERLRETLSIPHDIRVVAITPIGYPSDKPRITERLMKAAVSSRKRKPLEEIVHREKW